MALYSVAIRTPAAAANAPYADLRTTASDKALIREVGFFLAAATQTSLGLIRPLASGTASTTVLGQAGESSDPAATALLGSAWSAAPTVAATPIYLRRTTLPASIGAGLIWTFGPRDLVVPVSSSLLLWNFGAAAGSALDLYIVWEE